MNDEIRHLGVVDDVDGCNVKVRIMQSSACSACKIAKSCNTSESKAKIIDVYGCKDIHLGKGDNVVVIASRSSGFYAVFLSSVVPLFVLLIVLGVVLALTGREVPSALAGIGSLIPYYSALYLFRDKIRDKVSFRIEPC